MENKIKEIMASVFGVEVSKINEDTSPDTLEEWDSLKHMNLVVALEEEFNIEFEGDEIAELLNFKLFIITIKDKISEKSDTEIFRKKSPTTAT